MTLCFIESTVHFRSEVQLYVGDPPRAAEMEAHVASATLSKLTPINSFMAPSYVIVIHGYGACVPYQVGAVV